jgi:hypothetical protein
LKASCTYRSDVALGEDACRCKHRSMAHALAILNNVAIALLLRQHNVHLPQAQRFYNAHPDYALNLLFRAQPDFRRAVAKTGRVSLDQTRLCLIV